MAHKILLLLILPALLITLTGCLEDTTTPPQIVGRDSIPRTIELPKPPVVVTPKTPTYSNSKPLSGKVIVIDPGHGGKDPGAGQYGFSKMPEKEINLDIAKKLAEQLSSKGAKVVMTRTTDVFIELNDRAAFAERYNADLLVSIHADAHNQSSISGPSVYVARNALYKSQQIARDIVKHFDQNGVQPRGMRQSDFRVLVKHSKPAVLVECGYLTNPTEAKRLNANWYRAKIAQTIASGISSGMTYGK